MGTISLSGAISAPAVDKEEPPCQVMQQQDTEDTSTCSSSAENALNEVLTLLGISVPAPTESETYDSSLTVKPKNIYTSLNISLTHGDLSSPTYSSEQQETRIDVSTGDFRPDNDNYYIDIRSAAGLVETDDIKSVTWACTPMDDDLNAVSPQPMISVTVDDLLKSNKPANGAIKVKYTETLETYNFSISPRDDVDSGFYASSIVINAEGCEEKPFFYQIKVPPCFEQNRLKAMAKLKDDDELPDTIAPPRSPSGGEDYDCEYCLCSLRLKHETIDGMCPGSKEDTGNCKSGPEHKDC